MGEVTVYKKPDMKDTLQLIVGLAEAYGVKMTSIRLELYADAIHPYVYETVDLKDVVRHIVGTNAKFPMPVEIITPLREKNAARENENLRKYYEKKQQEHDEKMNEEIKKDPNWQKLEQQGKDYVKSLLRNAINQIDND